MLLCFPLGVEIAPELTAADQFAAITFDPVLICVVTTRSNYPFGHDHWVYLYLHLFEAVNEVGLL